jgi:hypothetical protein
MRIAAGLPIVAVVAVLACGGSSTPGVPDAGMSPEDPGPVPEMAGEDTGDVAPRDTTATDLFVPPDPGLPEDPGPEPVPEPVEDVAPDPVQDLPPEATDAGPDCPQEPVFDYTCTADKPATCPGGICALGFCIGPKLEPDRWAACGNGTCDPCETSCPADCGPAPAMTGKKEYVNQTTLTVWVHGFSNKSPEDMKTDMYGRDRGCPDILESLAPLGIQGPCGDTAEGSVAPNQFSKVEYYGGVPDKWLSEADVAEIEQYSWDGKDTLRRYALIVAKFLRHKLTVSGATHIAVACHSMGCLVTRYVIEHDLEHLASENRFTRWFTSAAVLAGARLARLYDNPEVQSAAKLINLELSDFVVMNPDFVQDTVAVWDHKLWEGNSPLYRGMILHHVGGTDPKIEEALGIALLDLNNPENLPNDGIMYTEDEYFHAMAPGASLVTPSGKVMGATHSLVHAYHMAVPDTDAAMILCGATLYGRRKVLVTLSELALKKDREAHGLFDSEHGTPPAEVSFQAEVRYNPYIAKAFGKDIVVHEDTVEFRSAPVFVQTEGTTLKPGIRVFEGPVYDAMDEFRLDFKLLEVDWYPRFQVQEWVFDIHESLADFHGQVPVKDHEIPFESEYAKGRMTVEVVEQY